jgi:hypothetical protein
VDWGSGFCEDLVKVGILTSRELSPLVLNKAKLVLTCNLRLYRDSCT